MTQKFAIFSLIVIFISISTKAQNNVGINTTTPHPSAALEIASTDKGMLVPRMSAAQKTAITAPATGLLIYQTDSIAGFYYYNGSSWLGLSNVLATISDSSQLQKITEGGNTGWRILGRNPANYGDIGAGATDLSINYGNSSTHGATGPNSIALGYSTTASGAQSTAMGHVASASGPNSTAMGLGTTASGDNSTAMGLGATASGNTSTAIGSNTEATGDNSTAMGYETKALGEYSAAMGSQTIASGEKAIAMGFFSKASGHISTAMGVQTTASGSVSTAMGHSTNAKSFAETALGFFNDTLMVADPTGFANDSNRVFTVGNGNSGNHKTAFVIQQNGNVGINQRRPSEKLDLAGSIKIVDGTQGAGKVLTSDANGKASWNTASPSQLEKITEAVNTGWRLLGSNPAYYGNIGDDAVDLSIGSSPSSSTRGATGSRSVAMGTRTTASGIGSTAMGFDVIASGPYSTAMGNATKASGQTSTATGYYSDASGNYSTAMGNETNATGIASTSMGSYSTASGATSTAMGYYTTASGSRSTAMGEYTIAKGFAETVVGSYNDTIVSPNANSFVANGTDRVFTVGVGTSASNRKTAFSVQTDGSVKIGSNGSNNKTVFTATASLGSSTTQEKTFTITTGETISGTKIITATIVNSGSNSEVFAVSISNITNTSFVANVYRIDGASWTQTPVIHYTITEQ